MRVVGARPSGGGAAACAAAQPPHRQPAAGARPMPTHARWLEQPQSVQTATLVRGTVPVAPQEQARVPRGEVGTRAAVASRMGGGRASSRASSSTLLPSPISSHRAPPRGGVGGGKALSVRRPVATLM